MEQTIRQLFLQTVNPNTSIRNTAEQQLKMVEKNPEALAIIQTRLMNDGDLMVRQSSSLFFANKVVEHYKAEELSAFIASLEANLLVYLAIADPSIHKAYMKIAVCFYDKAQLPKVQDFFQRAAVQLSSQNNAEMYATLVAYEKIFESDGLKYNLSSIFEIIFDQHGAVFGNQFSKSLQTKNFKCSRVFMKFITKSYMHYTLPDYLANEETFKIYFKIAMEIFTTTDESCEDAVMLKKWALYFLYKCSQKGIKMYFTNPKFVSFIRETDTLNILSAVFKSVVADYSAGKVAHESFPVYAAQFFDVCASISGSRFIIKDNCQFLLNNFIIPAYKYDEKLEGSFQFNSEEYLRERYNYATSEFRSAILSLFVEMVSMGKEIDVEIIKYLLENLHSPTVDLRVKYGIIGLLADVQKNILKALGELGFYDFIQTEIFPILQSKQSFMVSQALYFMSLSENIQMEDESTFNALQRVYELIEVDDENIRVEACLAMNFFFANAKLNNALKEVIPRLLQKVLIYAKTYYLEALNSLMDSIICSFTDDVAVHAPEFVDSIVENIMVIMKDSSSEEASLNIAGYLSTIDKLIMAADSKAHIVQKIYNSSSKVIYSIFKDSHFDIFQEGFDLMNTFLYSMEKVDAFGFSIFSVALTAENEELALYPREISDFIDNYLSFGKDDMITADTLLIMYNTIEMFLSEEEEMYDEDCQGACRIVDSMMLNCGLRIQAVNEQFIPHLVATLVKKFPFVEDLGTESLVLMLEAIMNCFVVSPDAVIGALGGFYGKFFELIWDNACFFKRVHDKKLFILFMGALFKCSVPIDTGKLNVAFVTIFSSLPEAIKRRNTLIDEEDNSEEEGNSDEIESYMDELQEDIYYSTPLDKFNAFDYTSSMLTSVIPDSVGANSIGSMSPSQIHAIQAVLSIKQPAQKSIN